MKKKDFITPKEDSTFIDLTPLVDVVLVLLIFFMVATTFSTTKSLDIKLPKTQNISKESEVKDIKVLIDANKSIYIRFEKNSVTTENKIEEKQLKDILSTVLKDNVNKSVSLVAHKALDYGYIVSLMEKIKGAGAQGLNIETEGEK